ncbi:hypothetical protein AVEN_80118-1 [Araneus ventricosus]|uniref:Uncharacterized protein n=1 Tax=Araneus ventricosus TaxID=182803 RepID=A0A4Y2PXG8_ARAVE|nr:hypothetical protein AVEN_80118-1 [Araneus ventricosus]
MIGEDLQKFSGSRVMRIITIGRLPIRNLPNIENPPFLVINNTLIVIGFDEMMQQNMKTMTMKGVRREITIGPGNSSSPSDFNVQSGPNVSIIHLNDLSKEYLKGAKRVTRNRKFTKKA